MTNCTATRSGFSTMLLAAFTWLSVVSMHVPGVATAEVFSWQEPAVDDWFYPGTLSPGTRTLAPTFYSSDAPGTLFDPARRGATMAAFRTEEFVATGLPATRYQVNSVTVTLTNAPGNGNIQYDNTYDAFADIDAGTDLDPGRPVELYGVGFANGYDRFGYGAVDYAGPEFEEGTPQFVPNEGYVIFPLGDDGQGNLTDVYSSPTGGYNALLDTSESPPWDTRPWALGEFPGLAPGGDVPYESTATFTVDLALPGVLDYVRQSLQQGTLGFFVSSLHQPSGHSGTITYPQWYNKEHATGQAPTLDIDVTILPEGPLGDTNGDGAVDLEDLNNVRNAFGASGNSLIGDTNGDNNVDLVDLNNVRNHFGESTGSSNVVPEPGTGLLTLIVSSATAWFLVRRGSHGTHP